MFPFYIQSIGEGVIPAVMCNNLNTPNTENGVKRVKKWSFVEQ